MLMPEELSDFVDEVAQAVVNAALLAAVDIPLNLVTPVGGIVYDCEMVAVSVSEIRPGLFDEQQLVAGCGPGGYQATVDIAIVRPTCALPSGVNGEIPPGQAEYLTDLESVSKDAGVLASAMEDLLSKKGSGSFSIALGEPNGGMIGVVATGTFPIGL